RTVGKNRLRSMDYQNCRVNTITAPMYVLTNTHGLIVALHISLGTAARLETVFLTFSYFATATRVMWEFNRIYRNLEGALTDAAQFAELLLDPPAVTDAAQAQPFVPANYAIELRNVNFRYSAGQVPLFEGFSLRVDQNSRVGLVGRSGGGKTTLTRLLLRFMDVESGEILVGGQPIDRVAQAALRGAIAYVPQDP